MKKIYVIGMIILALAVVGCKNATTPETAAVTTTPASDDLAVKGKWYFSAFGGDGWSMSLYVELTNTTTLESATSYEDLQTNTGLMGCDIISYSNADKTYVRIIRTNGDKNNGKYQRVQWKTTNSGVYFEYSSFCSTKDEAIATKTIDAYGVATHAADYSTLLLSDKNLITNGDFESGITGWDSLDTGYVIDSNDVYKGTYSLLLNAVGNAKEVDAITKEFAVKPSQEYILSAYVKQLVGSDKYKITIEWKDVDGNHISYINDWKGTNKPVAYQKQSALVYSPANATSARIFLGSWAGVSCKFDELSLNEIKTAVTTPSTTQILPDSVSALVNSMIFIPAGTFSMGDSNNAPVHSVTISSFSIGKYVVTQQQYLDVMGNNPSTNQKTGVDATVYPVETVFFPHAATFCNKLSALTGKESVYTINSDYSVTADFSKNGFRLPTEAEWEYACRAGTNTTYYWGNSFGDNIVDQNCWYFSNSGLTTHPVGQKLPNAFGLYDINGNVWQWCWDWYGDYSSQTQKNPTGPLTGTYKVIRGGSCTYGNSFVSSVYRKNNNPLQSDMDRGFRVVCK